jgi:hypothetical protein
MGFFDAWRFERFSRHFASALIAGDSRVDKPAPKDHDTEITKETPDET